MRLATVISIAALSAASAAAFAQPPRVAIEDDVSLENAVRCGALRTAQLQAGQATEPRLRALHEAWVSYLDAMPGYSTSKFNDEVQARLRQWRASPQFASDPSKVTGPLEESCKPFEIETAARGG